MTSKIFEQIKDALEILKLNDRKIAEVSHRKSATLFGVGILLIPPVINLILASFNFPSGFGVIFTRFLFWPMFLPVFSVVFSMFLMSTIVIKYFKGQGSYVGFFRRASYSGIILWVSILPYILAIFDILDPDRFYNLIWVFSIIWILVVSYKVFVNLYKITKQEAWLTIFIGIIGYLLFNALLGKILVGKYYRLFY